MDKKGKTIRYKKVYTKVKLANNSILIKTGVITSEASLSLGKNSQELCSAF